MSGLYMKVNDVTYAQAGVTTKDKVNEVRQGLLNSNLVESDLHIIYSGNDKYKVFVHAEHWTLRHSSLIDTITNSK